jgi:hypothetical protein
MDDNEGANKGVKEVDSYGIKTLTERKLNVPDRMVLFDGKTTKIIRFDSTDPLTYLRLCIDLNFYTEDGMI